MPLGHNERDRDFYDAVKVDELVKTSAKDFVCKVCKIYILLNRLSSCSAKMMFRKKLQNPPNQRKQMGGWLNDY